MSAWHFDLISFLLGMQLTGWIYWGIRQWVKRHVKRREAKVVDIDANGNFLVTRRQDDLPAVRDPVPDWKVLDDLLVRCTQEDETVIIQGVMTEREKRVLQEWLESGGVIKPDMKPPRRVHVPDGPDPTASPIIVDDISDVPKEWLKPGT